MHQYFAFGSEHTLGMKLHAAEVEGAVAQSHESAVGSCGDGFEHGGEAVGRNAPRMIASHSEGIGQPGKQIVRCSGKAGRGDTVAHLRKLMQTRTEDFGDGLMTEADTEDGFAAGVGADDVEQETGLARQSRAGESRILSYASNSSRRKRSFRTTRTSASRRRRRWTRL